MNPFPLLPMHVVVASAEHRPQGWILRGSTADTASNLLADFLELADRMPGYFGYFNGLDAGASIPGHLHFHFCQRPEGLTPFPLELAARRSNRRDGEAGLIDNYPLSGTFWHGTRESIFGPAKSSAGFGGSGGMGGALGGYAKTPMEKAIRTCMYNATKFIAENTPQEYMKY